MPASLIVAALVSAGAFTATSFAAAAVAVSIRLLTSYVVARVLIRRQGNRSGSSNNNDGARIQLPPATDNRMPVSYGTAWLRPTITDAKISNDQLTMWYVLPFCEVPDNTSGFGGGTVSFDEIRWDDKKLTFKPDGITVDTWINGANQYDTRVSGKIVVYRYVNGSSAVQPGYTHDNAIAILQNTAIAAADRWTSTDLMSKTAFLIISVSYDSDIGLTGLGTITAKVINTVTKPGDVIYDYLQNPRYGCGIDVGNINVTSLQNLSAYSDDAISFKYPNGDPGAIFRYRIDGPANTADDCYSNLQAFAEASDSWIQWNETTAQWGVVINRAYSEAAGTYPAQTIGQLFDINDDNIIGAIQLNPVDLNATPNRVEINYPDFNIYDTTGFVYIDLDAGDRNPNEPDNVLSLNFQTINNNVRAKYLGTRRLIQGREDLIVSFTMDYSGIQIDAGDVVRINNSKFAWNDKLFRVTQVVEGKDNNFLTAQIIATEYNPVVYDNIDITEFIPSPNTGITDPTIPVTPPAPYVTDENPALAVANFRLNGTISGTGVYIGLQYWYSTSANPNDIASYKLLKTIYPSGQTNYPVGSLQSYTVGGLAAGSYYYRTRLITINGGYSDFSAASAQHIWEPEAATYINGGNLLSNAGLIYDKIGWEIITDPPVPIRLPVPPGEFATTDVYYEQFAGPAIVQPNRPAYNDSGFATIVEATFSSFGLSNSRPGNGINDAIWAYQSLIWCEPGQNYYVSLNALADNCTGQLIIQWYNANRGYVGEAIIANIPNTNQTASPIQASPWELYYGYFTVPANMYYIRYFIRKSGAIDGNGYSQISVHKPLLCGVKDTLATTTIVPWSDGAPKLISGNQLAQNAISRSAFAEYLPDYLPITNSEAVIVSSIIGVGDNTKLDIGISTDISLTMGSDAIFKVYLNGVIYDTVAATIFPDNTAEFNTTYLIKSPDDMPSGDTAISVSVEFIGTGTINNGRLNLLGIFQ